MDPLTSYNLKKTTLISVFAANGFTSAIIVLFRISTVHGQLLTKNLMTASKSSPEASRPSRIASRNPVGSYCFFSSRNLKKTSLISWNCFRVFPSPNFSIFPPDLFFRVLKNPNPSWMKNIFLQKCNTLCSFTRLNCREGQIAYQEVLNKIEESIVFFSISQRKPGGRLGR